VILSRRFRRLRKAISEHFNERIDILPVEKVLENEIAAGRLIMVDHWLKAKEVVVAKGRAGFTFIP
jgi:hypothetical protein